MRQIIRFDDATIEKLFGAEDAENETDERFREYFFFSKVFDNLNNELPIRILVGHKGIGKSALLRRAFLSDEDAKRLAVWIRPGDLTEYRKDTTNPDFNILVEQWKTGLLASIAAKTVEHLTNNQLEAAELSTISKNTRGFIAALSRGLIKYAGEKFEGSNAAVINAFIKKTEIHVYIDDIDRGWSASPTDIKNISALLSAIRDISGAEQRIRFRIGLRSDAYFLVRTSDESTDKLERNVVWLNWTNDDILRVIAKRIQTYFDKSSDQSTIINMQQSAISQAILSKVMDPMFQGKGRWANKPVHKILLSLTRQRPRDLIKLMHGAAKNAFLSGSNKISSKNLENSFSSYSNERLQDIVNEFKSEVPEIEKLLLSFRPLKKTPKAIDSYLFTTDQLVSRIKNIMQNVPVRFRNGRPVTPRSLIQFLYKIDFITARKDHEDDIERKYFDESRFLASEIAEFGYDWEIHPAYRWALQPQSVHDILDSIRSE